MRKVSPFAALSTISDALALSSRTPTAAMRLVLRAKTWVSETVERWELADAGAAIAVWVSVAGPLGGVAGALNKLSYGSKLKSLAAEAERGR